MKILLYLLLSSHAFAFDTLDQALLDRFKAGTYSLYEISPGYDESIEHDALKNKKKALKEKEEAGVNLTLRGVPFAPADTQAEKIVQVKSCDEWVTQIRTLKPSAEIPNGDFPIALGFLEIKSKDRLIFDFAKERFCNGLGDLQNQYYTDTYGYSVSVVNVLGPLVTVSGYISSIASGAAKRYEGEWMSFNLQTQSAAKVSDFFDVDSVLRTLKTNPSILKLKASQKILKDKKLSKALARLPLEGFSVSALDEKRSLAKLHLGFKNIECETCANAVKQVALWVKPTPSFLAQLKNTQNKKEGYFLGLKSEKNINHFQK